MTEDEAKAKLIPPVKKGATVVVVRGRKVPHGTVGVVRWEGDGDYGPRVGLAVEGQDKLVYTAHRNVEAVYPGLKPGQNPEGGWVELHARVQREQLLPQKGHRVKHRESEQIGTVFWVEGSRLGFKTKANESGPKVTCWANAEEVVMLLPYQDPTIPAPPVELDYCTEVRATPETPWRYAVDSSSLPAPFNEITTLERCPDGYRGLNAREEYVATVPEQAAEQHFQFQFAVAPGSVAR